jgi:hypothetical protein
MEKITKEWNRLRTKHKMREVAQAGVMSCMLDQRHDQKFQVGRSIASSVPQEDCKGVQSSSLNFSYTVQSSSLNFSYTVRRSSLNFSYSGSGSNIHQGDKQTAAALAQARDAVEDGKSLTATAPIARGI